MLRKRRPKVAAQQASDPNAALSAAVALLARRDFCSAELAAKLAEQGYDALAIEATVADLLERHYVDDQRYTAQFVAYHAGRGQGPLRIRRDLLDLGLAGDLIDTAVAGRDQEGGWAALAREVRIRRFGLEPPDNWRDRARQARFLQYRGFSNDHIRSALGPDAFTDDD